MSNKKRKPMDDLPTMVSTQAVATVETATPMPTQEQLESTVAVTMPFIEWEAGYARRKLDVRLDTAQSMKLKGICLGLEKIDAQLLNGKFVANPVDAIRWMLENVR